MNKVFLFAWLISFQVANAQQTKWEKYKIDSNLTVELPANIEKGASLAVDKYSYEVVTAGIDSALYVVMVGTSKEKIEVNNMSDYYDAINAMSEGARKGAEEKNWTIIMSDVECDSIPGKKMSYTGKSGGMDAIGTTYFFLVNGLSYSFNIMFFKDHLSAKDSSDVNRFISSVDFTGNVREMQFQTVHDFLGYSLGRLLGLVIMMVIIIGVIIYVVRNI
jgi:hypothetical protein